MHVVVGAGIFGVSAALELRRRGLDVTLVDQGPIPNPLAESTDLSKAVRMDYGADETYCALMERALVKWRANPLFHETGVMYLSRAPMRPGGFEHDSFEVLTRRGHHVERITGALLRERYPGWNAELFVDGYFHPQGGWAESGRVVATLVAQARVQGVKVIEDLRPDRLELRGDRVVGVGGVEAEHVVVCSGAWTTRLLPELAGCFTATAQPVFHLAPREPALFEADRFPTYGADIATTGWYGFPLHANGVLKIANHGPGRVVSPDAPREAPPDAERALRTFLGQAFPQLADATLLASRACVYCDTRDGHFWIARHPERDGLTVATGGSGHAFKFAPLLGGWVADAALGVPNPELTRFRWRPELAVPKSEEAARCVVK
ncbi:MAG: FAD-dependent oxidoreductase [Archangiaceae bacterium]|nr:FAD-dependent oxidoreductase [Archangiaceae bacterium]